MSTSVLTFPLPALFFLRWIVLKQSLEGGGGGADPAFLLLLHENPASRYFSSLFRIPLLFPNTTTTTTTTTEKKSCICFIRICRMISRIPNIQEKNPPSCLNFQNFGETRFLGRCKTPFAKRLCVTNVTGLFLVFTWRHQKSNLETLASSEFLLSCDIRAP